MERRGSAIFGVTEIFDELVNFTFLLKESDDFHVTVAFGADQRVDLVDAFDESCPRGLSFWGSLEGRW